MNVLITLTVVMASWVYTYVKTHQTVFFKYVQFLIYQLCIIKLSKENFEIYSKDSLWETLSVEVCDKICVKNIF